VLADRGTDSHQAQLIGGEQRPPLRIVSTLEEDDCKSTSRRGPNDGARLPPRVSFKMFGKTVASGTVEDHDILMIWPRFSSAQRDNYDHHNSRPDSNGQHHGAAVRIPLLTPRSRHQQGQSTHSSEPRIGFHASESQGKALSVLGNGDRARVACEPMRSYERGMLVGVTWRYTPGCRLVKRDGCSEDRIRLTQSRRKLTQGVVYFGERDGGGSVALDEKAMLFDYEVENCPSPAIRDAFVIERGDAQGGGSAPATSAMYRVRWASSGETSRVVLSDIVGKRPSRRVKFDELSGLGSTLDAPLPIILSRLHPSLFNAFSRTCKAMKGACGEAVPGLHLSLYAHQRKALKWMIARENLTDLAWNGLSRPYLDLNMI